MRIRLEVDDHVLIDDMEGLWRITELPPVGQTLVLLSRADQLQVQTNYTPLDLIRFTETTNLERGLGCNQRAVLADLRRHQMFPGPWIWINYGTTVRILRSLVRYESLVTFTSAGTRGYGIYRPVEPRRAD